jgi:hypothetical protein
MRRENTCIKRAVLLRRLAHEISVAGWRSDSRHRPLKLDSNNDSKMEFVHKHPDEKQSFDLYLLQE